MAFSFPKFRFPFFSRDVSGNSFYEILNKTRWSEIEGTNIEIAQNHPILTPGILFLSKLFSQAEIYLENRQTKEKIYDHKLLNLLQKPNYYQTGQDFLETHNFMQIAEGKAIVWAKKVIGFNEPDALYVLDPNLIEYPDEFTTNLSAAIENNRIKNVKVLYDRDGENLKIPFKELLFFYDLPNALNTRNAFEVKSRLDGLHQTLINTKDSLIAKNIILKSNGKEMITGSKADGSFPFSNEEKKDAENLINNRYGLAYDRKRGLVTKASLTWKSMHIALRDLGLDESVKVDGNIIYTALHIPKDILSLEAKKTTYNNFKESMVSFIQNEMQPTLNSFLATLQVLIEDKNLILKGTYEHMPIMQFILIERFDGIMKRGQALSALRAAGLPDDVALEECGYDKNIVLTEVKMQENGNSNGTSEEEGENGEEGESDENEQNED